MLIRNALIPYLEVNFHRYMKFSDLLQSCIAAVLKESVPRPRVMREMAYNYTPKFSKWQMFITRTFFSEVRNGESVFQTEGSYPTMQL